MELVRRILLVAESDEGVFEGEQDSWVNVEGEVEIEWAAAAVFGVKIDLPDLAKRIGLNEVPLIMHMEAVVHRVVLELGDIAGDVDGCHEPDLSGVPSLARFGTSA